MHVDATTMSGIHSLPHMSPIIKSFELDIGL